MSPSLNITLQDCMVNDDIIIVMNYFPLSCVINKRSSFQKVACLIKNAVLYCLIFEKKISLLKGLFSFLDLDMLK